VVYFIIIIFVCLGNLKGKQTPFDHDVWICFSSYAV